MVADYDDDVVGERAHDHNPPHMAKDKLIPSMIHNLGMDPLTLGQIQSYPQHNQNPIHHCPLNI